MKQSFRRENGSRVPAGCGISIRGVLWAMLANFSACAFAQTPCPGIHVKVLNIRNSTGSVACALFESPVGFPTEYLRYATNIMSIKVRDRNARCDFEDMPPGTYALAVVHDENMNGKLDTHWPGVPTEGYGFSNTAKPCLARHRFPPPVSNTMGEPSS